MRKQFEKETGASAGINVEYVLWLEAKNTKLIELLLRSDTHLNRLTHHTKKDWLLNDIKELRVSINEEIQKALTNT